MSRYRLSAVFLLLSLVALWTSCASGPGAEPGDVKSKRPLDAAFDWQSRVLSDTQPLPAFEVGGTKIQELGTPCVILVPKSGEDPAEALKEAATVAAGE